MANLRTNNLFGESGQDSNGSALFDASNHLTAANVDAFRVNQGSSEDFTIEAWIYLRATPDGANARIASLYHTSGNQRSYMFYVHTDDQLKFNYASNGTAGSVSTLAGGTVPHNEWVHVAVTHDSSATTVRLFKNGLLKATDTGAHATYHANTSGDFTTGEDFNGNISNLHITRGTCKYTDTFTPSKEPIEEDSNTTVLCLNSRFNPLSDDKSNTFTQTSDGAVEASSFIPFDRADSGNVFNGPIKHNTQGYMYFPTGRTEERGRGRGIIVGGYYGPSSFGISGVLSAVEIASDGVTSKFGDLSETRYTVATVGSSTRSVFIGGAMPVSPSPFFSVNIIDFVTIATKGNAQDFGDSDEVGYFKTGVSSSTRGVYTRGRIYNPSGGTGSNALEFITIATQGNGQDFGDLVGGGRVTLTNAAMSPTRGILAGGVATPVGDPTTFVDTIEFVTMASLGNSVNFGDLQKSGGRSNGNCSSSTRGVFNIGTQSPADGNTIEFVTIATTGNAIDFGDLSGGQQMRGACSNKTRGLFAGGFVSPGSANYVNTCEKITIATTGNATDWGDVFEGSNRAYNSGISDSHGGLS